MPNSINPPRRLIAVLALLLAPVAAIATMTTARQPDEGQLCEIKATPDGAMVRLDGFANAERQLRGTYSFHVEKSGDGGQSTINQNGDFDAKPKHPELLSSVTLDTKGVSYRVTLKVVIGDENLSCTKQIDSD